MKGNVGVAQSKSFGDWLRMEDSISSQRPKDHKTVSGADMQLQVIGEDETWEYILAYCESKVGTGRVTLDLTDCAVYAFWTCPTFWDLVRSNALESLTFYAEDDDKTGARFIANLTGMKDIFARKVSMLSRLFVEELSVDAPNIYMKKSEDGYHLSLEDAFGSSGVMSIADFSLVERSVKSLRSGIGEGDTIHIDLRPYDIRMELDPVSKLALEDFVSIEVSGPFLSMIMREMAKLREKQAGVSYESYATKSVKEMVGSVGLLLYEKTSRGFCLPAKLTGIMGDTVLFEVISPVNGSCTDYRKFEVNVTIPHLSVDDVLAKRSGFHVFISEKFLSEDFRNSVLQKGFPDR